MSGRMLYAPTKQRCLPHSLPAISCSQRPTSDLLGVDPNPRKNLRQYIPTFFTLCPKSVDPRVLPNASWRLASLLPTLDCGQTASDGPMQAHTRPAKRAMSGKNRQNGQRTPSEDYSEFGEVRIISRPAPDAEDRLRRLFTILLKPSASHGHAASEKDSPTDDHLETEP